LICLPALLGIRFFSWAAFGTPEGGMSRALIAELTAYAIAWVGFALVSLPLAQGWGREASWPRFIAAWNWTNMVQYALMLALTVPAAIGLPPVVTQALTLGGIGYAFWLEWFVARHALGVAGGKAAALVGLDLALGLFLAGMIRTLSGG
jgi:predicted Kef-type K+ transport protein